MNRQVPVKDLREGMIVNEYEYNNEWISALINDIWREPESLQK